MAEPFTASDAYPDSRKHARTTSDASISGHSLTLYEGIRASKRLRTNSSKALEKPEALPPSPEVVYERRRVNPDSLAKRLGPELVGELNALIVPGNRDMPSFAVRKELQERYNIDRRHLYDYFHSKGLRVVKEDKHGNPIRQADQSMVAPQPSLRLLRQAPQKTPAHIHDLASISSDTKHKVTKSAPKPRAPRQPTIRLRKPVNSHKTAAKQSHPSSYPPAEPHYSQIQQGYSEPQYVASTPFVPSHYFTNPLQNYFVFDADDVSNARTVDESSDPSTPVFEKMIEQEHMEPRLLYPSPAKADSLAPSQKVTMRTDRQFMSQEERIAFYDFIDSVLGPASGVQESVGTYKAYMAEQSRLYFERILPGSHDHMRKVQAQTYVRSQTTSQPQVQSSADSVDFRKWLVSDGSADSSLDDQRSSAPHFYSHGTLVPDVFPAASRSGTSSLAEHAPYEGEDNIPRTLDDLFPDMKENSLRQDEALGSPVLRSNISLHSPIDLVNWKDYAVGEDDVAISPTLAMDSPSTQQTSPDIESSPFIQTPTSVYQQFIQHKDPYYSFANPVQTAHWTSTVQDGDVHHPAMLPPNLPFQDDDGKKNLASADVFTRYNARSLDTMPPQLGDRRSWEMARTKSRSSVARVRTSSAGGGI